jgi:hypothetical protein
LLEWGIQSPRDVGEPPDLFWWYRVQTSQRGIRQIDRQAKSRVARVASQLDIDSYVDPETTNIKLVARLFWLRKQSGRVKQEAGNSHSGHPQPGNQSLTEYLKEPGVSSTVDSRVANEADRSHCQRALAILDIRHPRIRF